MGFLRGGRIGDERALFGEPLIGQGFLRTVTQNFTGYQCTGSQQLITRMLDYIINAFEYSGMIGLIFEHCILSKDHRRLTD